MSYVALKITPMLTRSDDKQWLYWQA